MKAKVTDDCIGCGLCASLCPEVFTMETDLARAQTGEIDSALEDKALDAKVSCPVNAIETE